MICWVPRLIESECEQRIAMRDSYLSGGQLLHPKGRQWL